MEALAPLFVVLLPGIILFLFVLAILWFLLPFAIFGFKAKLDTLIYETQMTNYQFKQLITILQEPSKKNRPKILFPVARSGPKILFPRPRSGQKILFPPPGVANSEKRPVS